MNNRLFELAQDRETCHIKIKALFEKEKLNVNVLHPEHKTGLVYFAAQGGSVETLKYFIEELQADLDASQIKRNLIYWAIQNKPDVIKYIASLEDQWLQKLNDGTTALHTGAAAGLLNKVQDLIALNPARINEASIRGETALYWAAANGKNSIVHFIETHPHFQSLLDPSKFDSKLRGQSKYASYSISILDTDNTFEKIAGLEEALNCTEQIVHKNSSDFKSMINDCFNLINLHLKTKNFTKAKFYTDKSVQILEKLPKKKDRYYEDLVRFYRECSKYYYKYDHWTDLQNCLQKALFCCQQLSDNSVNKQPHSQVINDDLKVVGKKIALANEANRWGFDCKDVDPDGSCFFHAVLLQLKLLEIPDLKNFSVQTLRQKTVDHLEKEIERYKDFIEEPDYLKNMRSDDTRADHIAITAFSNEFNVTIAILRSNGSNPNIIKQPNPIATIYLGYEVDPENSGITHYQSLIPKDEKTSIQSIQNIINQTNVNDCELNQNSNQKKRKSENENSLVNKHPKKVKVLTNLLVTIFNQTKPPFNPQTEEKKLTKDTNFHPH